MSGSRDDEGVTSTLPVQHREVPRHPGSTRCERLPALARLRSTLNVEIGTHQETPQPTG